MNLKVTRLEVRRHHLGLVVPVLNLSTQYIDIGRHLGVCRQPFMHNKLQANKNYIIVILYLCFNK